MTTPSATFWEARYRDADPGRGTPPNTALVTLLTDLDPAPGRAWDLGCGHGGDALWLASLGWQVTATDVSATAIMRVMAATLERGLTAEVTAERHDLSESRPRGTFDLVYACYFNTPIEIPRTRILRDAAATVTPGGLFILIDHASTAPSSRNDDRHPTPGDTLAALNLDASWHPERLERADLTTTAPDGETATVTDTILALRRR